MVPITQTICSTVAQPCGPGPGGSPCPATGAAVATDGPFGAAPGVETIIDFDVDVFEIPPTDADSINERILIGADAVYAVVYTAENGAGSGTITVRIKVNGITVATFVQVLDILVPTAVSEQINVALNSGDALTVTVEPSLPGEGAFVNFASLSAVKVCGPATDVIVVQG
jgi:hypothetical protein